MVTVGYRYTRSGQDIIIRPCCLNSIAMRHVYTFMVMFTVGVVNTGTHEVSLDE